MNEFHNDGPGKFFDGYLNPSAVKLAKKDAWIGICGYPAFKGIERKLLNQSYRGMEWGGTISQVEYSEEEDSGLIYSKNINLEGG